MEKVSEEKIQEKDWDVSFTYILEKLLGCEEVG